MNTRTRIENLLQKSNCSAPDAKEKAFTVVDHARTILRQIHAAKMSHIVEWRSQGRGPHYPVYAWGPGEDKERPAPIPVNERMKAYYRRKKGGN